VLLFAGLAWWGPTGLRWSALYALLLLLGAAAFGFGAGWLLALTVPVVAAGLGGCFGVAWRAPASRGVASHGVASRDAGGAGRRGYAAAGGMLVFALGAFAFYAAYDIGYPNGWVPPLIAVIVGGVAVWRARAVAVSADRPVPAAPPVVRLPVLAGTGMALLLIAAGVWWLPPAEADPPAAGRLRVVAYNVRMGFGLDGRFSVDDLAAVIRSQRPDVVMLSEVDRGWALNGGHDDLVLLARAVGMRYLFAPAADPVWGDAILTNLPVLSTGARRLPAHGAPTGAQVLGAVLRHGSGEVAVVSTHLQPPPGREAVEQARVVAQFAAAMRTGARPVIVAGDFNTQPGEAAFQEMVAGGFTDALAASRPLPTSPSDVPRNEIDHIFVLGGTASEIVAPRGTASDHLAVAATITW
jgi:endonuclease/exonuclease/phosphatase family metal-dependent hydrolase